VNAGSYVIVDLSSMLLETRDRRDGRLIWKSNTSVGDQRVVYLLRDTVLVVEPTRLTAYASRTGKRLWRRHQSPGECSIEFYTDRRFVCLEGECVRGYGLLDGRELWSTSEEAVVPVGYIGNRAFLYDECDVYCITDWDGAVTWRRELPDQATDVWVLAPER
jgi:outer membrane protein assembly factor BamB